VLATLTVQGANVLLLDEPTNHLDIASQEVLQDVLTQFEGTVLFISHDRYLIDKLATEIWVVEGRDIRTMTGNWHEYLHWRRKRLSGQSGRPAASEPVHAAKPQQHQKQREGGKHRPELAKVDAKKAQPAKEKPAPAAQRDTRNRESYQHKRQRQKTERQLEALEKEIQTLEAKLKLDSEAISHASLAQDVDKVRKLAGEYQQGDAKLKDMWYQWAVLSESLDKATPESNDR
jgi:ATP-binding cassette, subfamily F, member 3